MRVLVCGGRDFADKAALNEAMDRLRGELGITHVITGAQRKYDRETKRWLGADYHAEEWARSRCLWYTGLAANWDKHGPAAGPKRNRTMLTISPEAVIAFPGGKGTADMIAAATEAGIRVIHAIGSNEVPA